MTYLDLPYLLEPDGLEQVLGQQNLIIVCLGQFEKYFHGHIPGATWLDPGQLNRGSKPITGLVPNIAEIETAFRSIGLESLQHVVCYDDDGGTRAARMMWMLEAMGHKLLSVLNGGLMAWQSNNRPLEHGHNQPKQSLWTANPDSTVRAAKTDVLAAIQQSDTKILDARSPEEHQGLKSAAARFGRIPGSINLNWLDTIDEGNFRKLKSADALNEMLRVRGISKQDKIIVHCQTHQRSSHCFVMLRSLGYQQVRGYPGSWSEWAADPNLPIETG